MGYCPCLFKKAGSYAAFGQILNSKFLALIKNVFIKGMRGGHQIKIAYFKPKVTKGRKRS